MFIVAEIGIIPWVLISSMIPFPWLVVVMAGYLCLYYLFFSGRWGHQPTKQNRRNSFRRTKLTREAWTKGLLAAGLFVIISQASLVVYFRIIEFPAELFTVFNWKDISPWTIVPVIIMAALTAGICEEVGFRGYGQVLLEGRYRPIMANLIVSIGFLILHLNQAWALPMVFQGLLLSLLLGYLAYKSNSLIFSMIGHTLMDICLFSYWWSDIFETFNYPLIGETGIDAHFLSWGLIFVISLTMFTWVTRSLNLSSQPDAVPIQ